LPGSIDEILWTMGSDQLVEIAEVMACRTRMDVLAAVGPTGCGVTEAARRVGISQPTATYHLRRLLEIGFVRVARRGRRHVYRWGRERWFLSFTRDDK
jgi:DNA-binding transcriptional ArsR family regulator